MIRIIKFLITGRWSKCDHEWSIIDRYEIDVTRNSEFRKHTFTRETIILQCKKCGDVKIKKIII